MARLNIEERLFSEPRARRLALALGWNEFEAIGLLNFLWYDSQSKDRASGTSEEILEWTRADMIAEGSQLDKIVPALLKCGFISEEGNDCFLIHGNENQIKDRKFRLSKARKAAEARWTGKEDRVTENPEPHQKGVAENPEPQQRTLQENREPLQDFAPEIGYPPLQKIGYPHPKSEGGEGNLAEKVAEKQPVMLGACSSNALACHSIQYNTMQDSKKESIPSGNLAVSDPVAVAQGTVSNYQAPKIWAARITDQDREIAQNWLRWAKTETPKGRYSLEKFTESVCKIRVNHDLTYGHIDQLLQYVMKDNFWKNKALSPTSLLKPSKSEPEITKLEQVVRSIQGRKKTQDELLRESLERQVSAAKTQDETEFDNPFNFDEIPENTLDV